MAGAPGSVVNLDAFMKQVMDPKITTVFETTATLYNEIDKVPGVPSNTRGYELSFDPEATSDDGWLAPGGDLPLGDARTGLRGRVYAVDYYKTIRLQDKALDVLDGTGTAVGGGLQYQMKAGTEDAIKVMGQMIYGSGNGAIGTVASVAGAVITTKTPRYSQQLVKSSSTTTGLYQAFTTGGTQHNGDIQLTAIDKSAHTATAATAASINLVVADDILVRKGSFNRAMTGLAYHIASGGLWQEIDRSANPQFNATSVAANTDLDQLHLRQIQTKLEITMGTGESVAKKGFLSNPGQVQNYHGLGYQQVRYEHSGGTTKIDAGFKWGDTTFEGKPWSTDLNCPENIIYTLDMDTFFRTEVKSLQIDKTGGTTLHRVPQAVGAGYRGEFVFYLVCRTNIGCRDPRKNGSITGLTLATGVH